jgi:hypothetical protein
MGLHYCDRGTCAEPESRLLDVHVRGARDFLITAGGQNRKGVGLRNARRALNRGTGGKLESVVAA